MAAMLRSPRSGRHVRLAAFVTASLLLAAACAGGGDSAPTLTAPVFVPPAVESTLAGIQPDVVVTEPTPPATEASVESTPPATITTEPPVTTTTEPLAVQELLLRGDGLGSALFGAAPEGVIEYVTSILGGNTADTGWVDPFTFAACDGTLARRVDWGVLSLLFGDLSSYADGRRHFMGWEYGRVGQIGDEPVGLRTEGGTTLGSRVVDLLANFPEAGVNEGEDDLDIPPNFYVSDNFRGLLTGTSPDDFVTVIFGGYGCAE
jgi:hypothetical protein